MTARPGVDTAKSGMNLLSPFEHGNKLLNFSGASLHLFRRLYSPKDCVPVRPV